MPHWFLSRHWGAGSQPGWFVCVIFCNSEEAVRHRAWKWKQNRIFSLPVTDFCGSFVLLFLLAVRLNFSAWEMGRDACIFIQDTDGHSLLWLRLRLGCACHGNRREMQKMLQLSEWALALTVFRH